MRYCAICLMWIISFNSEKSLQGISNNWSIFGWENLAKHIHLVKSKVSRKSGQLISELVFLTIACFLLKKVFTLKFRNCHSGTQESCGMEWGYLLGLLRQTDHQASWNQPKMLLKQWCFYQGIQMPHFHSTFSTTDFIGTTTVTALEQNHSFYN